MSNCKQLETNENIESLRKEIENLNKETENIKKNQMEILHLKNTISKMRISVNGLYSKMEGTEEKTVNWMIEQSDQ